MLHARLERELTALGVSATWLDYRLFLCRMYGFLAPVERALAGITGLAGAVRDAAKRNNKTALLALDLTSLGVDRSHLAQIPRIAMPLLDELPEALGWMYVIEAATQGSETLANRLAPRLTTELEHASAYLRCYGDETGPRWRAFGTALDAYVARADVGTCDRIVLAATDCLIRLHRWLSASSPLTIQSRHIHA